ncbi:MAG: anti-sigma factor antagonist [Planctomycetota bacterium]|nr:anti-sigma factor antagonist [Planctomycetota bacterium]
MKISYQDYDHVCVLTISGEYTADDVDQFNRLVTDRLGNGARHIMLDCEHLEFIDSLGLESWLRLREQVGGKGGQIRLIKPDDTIAKILEITRLDHSFESHPTIEAAVRSVR